MNDLQVTVQKAVRAPLAPSFLRAVLRGAMGEPRVAERALELCEEQDPAVTVRIASDSELHRLNRDFLGEDHATDVLSFPSGSAGSDGYLGDLAISWAAVLRQAEGYRHAPEVEAALLAVHGLLHLLGWDHAEPAEEREMTALTLACLVRSDLHPSSRRLDVAE